MDEPLKIWYCDVCGKPINNLDEAMLIWRSENDKDFDFKIVHQTTHLKKGCDIREYPYSAHVSEFLGDKGLTYLLSFLSLGKARKEKSYRSVKDMDEFVDLIRRFQIPYYEEARRYFQTPETQELIEGTNEYYPYMPKILKRIIEVNTHS